MPDWYLVLRAAKYLGVAPWELTTMPLLWMNQALEAEGAEMRAEREQRKQERRKKAMH